MELDKFRVVDVKTSVYIDHLARKILDDFAPSGKAEVKLSEDETVEGWTFLQVDGSRLVVTEQYMIDSTDEAGKLKVTLLLPRLTFSIN